MFARLLQAASLRIVERAWDLGIAMGLGLTEYEFGVWGLGFRDWGSGIRVSGVGTRVWRCRAVSGAVLEGLLRESRS